MTATCLSTVSSLRLHDGNLMPILGLGVYSVKTGGEAERACLSALKHGYRLIDTAVVYENEEDVGIAVQNCSIPRKEIFITTKLWDTDHGRDKTFFSCKESLRKLRLDYIDLYLMHSPLGGKVLETWNAMVELKERGLVKSIGVSNFNVHHLEGLCKARPDHIPTVNQIEYHPYIDMKRIIDYCKQQDTVVEAYSPLTRGVKLKDPFLSQIADKYKKSTAQLMIRWCIEQGMVCIPKSVKEQRIIENADVFDFQISPGDMHTLNGLRVENLVCCLYSDWDPLPSPWEP